MNSGRSDGFGGEKRRASYTNEECELIVAEDREDDLLVVVSLCALGSDTLPLRQCVLPLEWVD